MRFPYKDPKNPHSGFSPRGMDIDSNGVVWAALASGHLASFDRQALQGSSERTGCGDRQGMSGRLEAATPSLARSLRDSQVADGSAEAPYYDWVDQYDTLGLGKNVPIATGNESDALFALVDSKWVTMRVPYPIGYFAKGMDGRIDDPSDRLEGQGNFVDLFGSLRAAY